MKFLKPKIKKKIKKDARQLKKGPGAVQGGFWLRRAHCRYVMSKGAKPVANILWIYFCWEVALGRYL